MPQGSIVAMFKAVDVQDWGELRHYYAADCIYERPGFATIEGLDALIHFYKTLRPIESGRHILDKFVEQGECRISSVGDHPVSSVEDHLIS
jgi:hypothetical protein